MSFIYEMGMISHQGRKREMNQDNFLLDGRYYRPQEYNNSYLITRKGDFSQLVTAAVFDGLGGENDGEKASEEAVLSFSRQMGELETKIQSGQQSWEDALYNAVNVVNQSVVDLSKKNRSGISGTTMTLFLGFQDDGMIANIGDSPAWVLRAGRLHAMIHPDIRQKKPSKPGYPPKGPLTQYVGMDIEDFELIPNAKHFQLQEGDRVLLCSDGLGDMVPTLEIEGILKEGKNVEESVRVLLEKAIQNGGRDNITICLVDIFSNQGGNVGPVSHFINLEEIEATSPAHDTDRYDLLSGVAEEPDDPTVLMRPKIAQRREDPSREELRNRKDNRPVEECPRGAARQTGAERQYQEKRQNRESFQRNQASQNNGTPKSRPSSLQPAHYAQLILRATAVIMALIAVGLKLAS